MGLLFNIPQRKEDDIFSIIKKTQEYNPPKIKLRGTTLQDRIKAISENIIKYDYELLDTDDKFMAYVEEAMTKPMVALDTETTGLEFNDQKNLVGISIMGEGMKPTYAPLAHIDNITEELEPQQISKECAKEMMLKLFQSNTKFIYHHYYYDAVVFYFLTRVIPPVYTDTLIISHYLNENESHVLKDLYTEYVLNGEGEVDHYSDLFSGIPFCYIPSKIAGNYAAQDGKMTLELYKFYEPFITKGTSECKEYHLEKISDLIKNVEIPLLPTLADMRIRGIEFDFERAKELHDKFTTLRDEAEKKLFSLLDEEVNYNSPKQVAELLYDKLKLPDKSNRSTDAKALKKLNHPVAKAILGVKTYDKLLGSFIDKLTLQAREMDGKIHFGLNSCGTVTKRFSSNNPKQDWVYAA